jgi:hypothetical protein
MDSLEEINKYVTNEIIRIAAEESGVSKRGVRRYLRGEIAHNESVPYIIQLCQKRKENIELLANELTLK